MLLPFSWAYGLLLAARNFAYDQNWKKSEAVAIPVISIGNITAGGTGKTPMAEFLLEKLQAMGHHPAYLSRGYGRKTTGFHLVKPFEGDALTYGDEAFQVANRFPNLPVAVCEDRIIGATRLIKEFSPSILVLDDAFQHRKIRRNLDLVMIDCTRPPHKDFLLPAGRLRESRKGLQRADWLVFSKFKDEHQLQESQVGLAKKWPNLPQIVMELKPTAFHSFQNPAEKRELTELKGMPIVAFSGIGNNAHFQAMLLELGADIRQFFHFPDHFSYTQADIEKILQAFEAEKEIKGKLPPALILTTEKDYFRLKQLPWMSKLGTASMAFVRVEMDVKQGWTQLENEIKKIARERL